MLDVLDDLMRWWEAGRAVGLATVTATWSSAPRQIGAAMLVGPDGTAVGSVSGGCVEGAVYQLCREVAEIGEAQTVRYGIADDDAFEVGCPAAAPSSFSSNASTANPFRRCRSWPRPSAPADRWRC